MEGRYVSTFKALVGNIDLTYDSSGGARIMRAKNAISSIIDEPFGTGWGSQVGCIVMFFSWLQALV